MDCKETVVQPGHNGCIRRAREAVYYPGLTADIKRIVGNCETCQRYHNDLQKEPLRSHTAPSRPWQKVDVDIFTFRDQDYLITADYLSGYFEVDRLNSKRVSDIVYCLKQQSARHGLPTEVVSSYNNVGAREREPFARSQTVRAKLHPDKAEWRKAEVVKVLPHRSYELRFEDGAQRRRTSKHIRFSSEQPLAVADDDCQETLNPTPDQLGYYSEHATGSQGG